MTLLSPAPPSAAGGMPWALSGSGAPPSVALAPLLEQPATSNVASSLRCLLVFMGAAPLGR
jgi:hypothetical protein